MAQARARRATVTFVAGAQRQGRRLVLQKYRSAAGRYAHAALTFDRAGSRRRRNAMMAHDTREKSPLENAFHPLATIASTQPARTRHCMHAARL